ncbi:MAG: response regulator [Bryobacteraceae bacterium]|nr:response regulator [Bryobacteraceae bacterium]
MTRECKRGAGSSATATLLSVSPNEEDHRTVEGCFRRSAWPIRKAATCLEAERALGEQTVAVMLCERELPDGDWKRLLEMANRRAEPPLVVVTSRLADERLWAEVLNLGGYDLLMKPWDRGELTRVLELARLNWQEGRAVRT